MLGGQYLSVRGVASRFMSTAAARVPRKRRANRPIIVEQRARNADLDVAASTSELPWRLVGATVLHRYPIITRDLKPWEIAKYEIEEEDLARRKKYLLDEIVGTPAQFIPETEPTVQEILDSMPFQPASRITEADTTNDRRSTERRLQDSLFLIVKRKRGSHEWQFPQGKLQPEETFRVAGERVLDRAVGKTSRYFISNAPIGHYQYRYPDALQTQRGNFGAKVFFYRAQLLAGSIKLETKLYTDYAWIARDEVHEYFDPETAEFMSKLLPH